jgi:hypothetical protein
MDHSRQRIFPLAVALLCLTAARPADAGRFFDDDPISAAPRPMSVGSPEVRPMSDIFDFLYQSFRPRTRPPAPAGAVNTLGEVPDSAWFVNRHGRRRMTRDELRRGPGDSNPPIAPYVVVGAKTEGISPGFQMRDARGRLYFVKPDPASNPEMATAAEVIGTRFFSALGYHVPETYIATVRRSELSIHENATVEGAGGKRRSMKPRDLNDIFDVAATTREGSMRILASLALEGRPLGPFRYEGTRSDDPNDIVPHENRRDLRGLHVFCAWLNHTDSKANNSLDMLVEQDGVRFIRHHLIDFGAILGSDSDMAKDPRFGNEYIIPTGRQALRGMFTFGLTAPDWERVRYPKLKAAGRFESGVFDPEKWKGNYPNPAFLSRLPDDEYWAATHVMAFTGDDILAIVETGQYSDPAVTEYITKALIERRDKIGRAYLQKVLALDNFHVAGGGLRFDDLLVKYGFSEERAYEIAWSRFNNKEDIHEELAGEKSFQLPREWNSAPEGSYYAGLIHAQDDPARTVRVYLRKRGGEAQVAGVERAW